MKIRLTKAQRLEVIIGISFSFFLAEIGVGFYTKSLALVADAFHYLNDLVGFVVALVAFKISERSDAPKMLSFGWQRANLLGAFFNGVFLLALGVSIFLQAIERFVSLQEVEYPKLVLIVGCVGLALNIISAIFLHEHDEDVKAVINEGTSVTNAQNPHGEHRHETLPQETKQRPGHDLGLMGVLIHVIGDAANNVGVIIAASVIWQAKYPARFYADPAVSVAIAIMILSSALPLVRKTGAILLETSPDGVDPNDVRYDLETVSGVLAVHELHIWRLNQQKSIASAHIVVSKETMADFMTLANTINECFHAYGIHSATLQPEVMPAASADAAVDRDGAPSSAVASPAENQDPENLQRRPGDVGCQVKCPADVCEDLTCCG